MFARSMGGFPVSKLCLFAKMWHVSQIFPLPLVQAQQLRPFVLGTYGRAQHLRCLWGPFKGLKKMAARASRISRSSVRPCYTNESWRWAQEAVLLHRIFSVTRKSRRLSSTLAMHLESQPSLCIFATLSSTWLTWPLLHHAKRVNISSGGYI